MPVSVGTGRRMVQKVLRSRRRSFYIREIHAGIMAPWSARAGSSWGFTCFLLFRLLSHPLHRPRRVSVENGPARLALIGGKLQLVDVASDVSAISPCPICL